MKMPLSTKMKHHQPKSAGSHAQSFFFGITHDRSRGFRSALDGYKWRDVCHTIDMVFPTYIRRGVLMIPAITYYVLARCPSRPRSTYFFRRYIRGTATRTMLRATS